jgi:putative tryptophan/tyrosine transport system substrate-binding protein
MRRREFITLVGGAATWRLAARAETAGKVPRIGFLGLTSPSTFASRLEGFRQGLCDYGYVEGTSIIIEYRLSARDAAMLAAVLGFYHAD